MTVLSFPHYRQNSFDYVHVGEEIDFKYLVHQANGTVTLRELLHGANNS